MSNFIWYKDKDILKLLILLTITTLLIITEIVVGIIIDSLILLSDAFHNFSDGLSLLIALIAVFFTHKKSTLRTSFGWDRAGIIGGFATSIFLIGIFILLAIEAIQKLIEIEPVDNPLLITYVASFGLALNILGLILLRDHSGHGHSHGHGHGHNDGNSKSDKPAENLNFQAIFIHLLGDFIGTLTTMASGLAMHFIEPNWKYYIDPAVTLLVTIIIITSSIRIIKRCLRILMQVVPHNVEIAVLTQELESIPDLLSIHDLHIWSLSESKFIASIHIVCLDSCDFDALLNKIKSVFHKHEIHSSTIQPEFISRADLHTDWRCKLYCQPLCDSKNLCCAHDKQFSDQPILTV